MRWLEEHWPKSTLFLAVYTSVLLFLFVFPKDTVLFLLWIQTPIYWLHQFEEYVLPGGFVAFFNKRILQSDQEEWPLNKTGSLWINIPIIFIGFPVSAILAGQFGPSIAIWTAYFSIINALSHVGMFFRLGYNPGLLVSATLNIPVGLFTVISFFMNGTISTFAHIVGLLIAIFLQGGLMFWGFLVLKPKVKQRAAQKHA